MKSILAVSLSLFVAAVCAGLWTPDAADASCCQPEGQTCAWQASVEPADPQADGAGAFSYVIRFDYCFSESGTIGGDFVYESEAEDNIESVGYSPSWFFANNAPCSGTKVVTVTGELDENDEPGSVRTEGSAFLVGGASCDDDKVVDIDPAT